MLENVPLLVPTNISNFSVASFSSWKDIGYLLNIDQLDIAKVSAEEIASIALEESGEWSTQYQRVRGRSPTEAELLLRENDVACMVNQYYSVERIVSEQLKLESLVCDINKWSLRGPDRPYLFGNVPNFGVGLHYWESDSGVSFTVCSPFMIPYIELFYDRTQKLPDWGLEEIGGLDIVEAMVQLQHKLGKEVIFSADNENEREVLSGGSHRVY